MADEPAGSAAATASWSILRHRESKKVKLPIDAVGLGLLVIGVGSLQFMLDNGNEKDWFNSPVIMAAAIVGRKMNKLNLRLAASFAFCVFAFAIFWAGCTCC